MKAVKIFAMRPTGFDAAATLTHLSPVTGLSGKTLVCQSILTPCYAPNPFGPVTVLLVKAVKIFAMRSTGFDSSAVLTHISPVTGRSGKTLVSSSRLAPLSTYSARLRSSW